MSRAPSAFRKRDVTKAVEAVRAAGCDVQRVEVGADGAIKIITADKPQDCEITERQANGGKGEWDNI